MLDKIVQAFVWPSLKSWRMVIFLYVGFGFMATPLAMRAGLIHHYSFSTPQLLQTILVTLFIPSFVEEFIYRYLLVPRPDHLRFWHYGFLSLVFYVLSHPFSAWLWRHEAREVFYNFAFLFITTLLGFICLLSYQRTTSLWPSIILHWVTVVIWLSCGGKALLD